MLGINRKFWCMQLHPDAGEATDEYTRQCLDAGYIGLDFKPEHKLGDLRGVDRDNLEDQSHYYDFYERMDIGDIVVVVLGNKPVALVKVVGEYKYSPNPSDKVKIWCSHYRKVEILSYYNDDLDAKLLKGKQFVALGTIQIVNPENEKRYPFILEWLEMVG